MGMSKILGTILIVLGLIGILWGGFSYTTQKKVIDIGPIQATREKKHEVPVSPVAGAVSLIAGVAFLVTGKRT
jgi:drug/metabolite transporter (DMT)-like permease